MRARRCFMRVLSHAYERPWESVLTDAPQGLPVDVAHLPEPLAV